MFGFTIGRSAVARTLDQQHATVAGAVVAIARRERSLQPRRAFRDVNVRPLTGGRVSPRRLCGEMNHRVDDMAWVDEVRRGDGEIVRDVDANDGCWDARSMGGNFADVDRKFDKTM